MLEAAKPRPIKYFSDGTGDLQHLDEAVEDYMDFLESDEYNEDEVSNYENQIFEKALEAFYGPDVWDYVNDRLI